MRENQSDIFAQLYFFSAGYGVVNRLLNDKWDAELSLIHTVLQATYREIQSRLQASSRGEQIIAIPERLMPAIIEATEKLAVAIQDKRDGEIYPILARFSELSYAGTGNGYYLFLKGEIKI
jgi:hypothetical protein